LSLRCGGVCGEAHKSFASRFEFFTRVAGCCDRRRDTAVCDEGGLLDARAYALAQNVPSVKTDSAFMIAAYPGFRFPQFAQERRESGQAPSWAIIVPPYGLASCRNKGMPARDSSRRQRQLKSCRDKLSSHSGKADPSWTCPLGMTKKKSISAPFDKLRAGFEVAP